jgi:isopropylmalate/homocitrate/citramalate synthase
VPEEKIMRKIELYDTTLRDGAQSEDIAFSVEDKLRIAERLNEFGIHYIEGGWPGANPKDAEFFKLVRKLKFKSSTLCAFGATHRASLKPGPEHKIPPQCKDPCCYHSGEDMGFPRERGPESIVTAKS